jgi:glycosyltransferase involved in cell wall biosynthesis
LPAYNEAAHVGEVVRQVRAQDVAVLVIDDGSEDGTADTAAQAGARVLKLERNQGKGAALREGFIQALREGYAAVITMDADGQHSPEDLPAFTAAYRRTGIPVLIGNRMGDPRGMPLARRLTNRVMSALLNRRLRQFIPDTQNGFRLYQSDVLPLAFPQDYGYAAESEILLELDRLGVRMDSVPVRTIYGDERSGIHPLRDAFRFLLMLRRFSRRAA